MFYDTSAAHRQRRQSFFSIASKPWQMFADLMNGTPDARRAFAPRRLHAEGHRPQPRQHRLRHPQGPLPRLTLVNFELHACFLKGNSE